MEIKKYATRSLPLWTKDVPFQIKGVAIKEAHSAFWKAKGRPRFRTKKDQEQSCFIPKTAIKPSGIYPRVSGTGLRYSEPLPKDVKDSRLIWRFGKWWMSAPSNRRFQRGESQAYGVVALDPGIRTFITYYSPDRVGKIGEGDYRRIFRLLLYLDGMISKRAKMGRRKARSLTKAIRRHRHRISSLVDELHWKTARFLCENFAVILLPSFETKQMMSRQKRKIRSKTVRSMAGFRFFQFKSRLKWMARKLGVAVLEVSEAYTSKTHPQTGKVHNIGSARYVRLLDGSWVDRDIVGAHNVLVKWLTERCALGDTPAQVSLSASQ